MRRPTGLQRMRKNPCANFEFQPGASHFRSVAREQYALKTEAKLTCHQVARLQRLLLVRTGQGEHPLKVAVVPASTAVEACGPDVIDRPSPMPQGQRFLLDEDDEAA